MSYIYFYFVCNVGKLHSSIHTLPDVLILHLQRLVITSNGGGKIRTLVKFPLSQLNMRPFTTGKITMWTLNLLCIFSFCYCLYLSRLLALRLEPKRRETRPYTQTVFLDFLFTNITIVTLKSGVVFTCRAKGVRGQFGRSCCRLHR